MKRILLLFLIPFTLLLFSCSHTSSREDTLKVHVLDVGKADCIVVQTGTHTLMIDTGEEENLPEILAYFESNQIRRIDTLILSHFDKDHIGGAEKIIRSFSVDEVIESSFSSDREEYTAYHKAISEKSTSLSKLSSDRTLQFDDCTFNILVPQKHSYEKKEDNNASLIVSLQYKGKNMLFCGDAMEDRLSEFIAQNNVRFDFVKLPYHGRYLENYPGFLESVNCTYAALCDSEKNPAAEETIKLLEEKKIEYYSTKNGSIRITFDGERTLISQ